MERLIEHKLKPAMRIGFQAICLCVLVLLYLLSSMPNPLWAQSAPAYEGVSVEGGENSFAFLIFNTDYNKGISPVIDVVENKKGILALLSGLAIPPENILVLENPSKSDLEDEIYEFSRRLSPKADLLVYYNGHSVNFADTPENEILLTSFKLPRSNDLFLLERRVSRSSVDLSAMISDFIPKRVGHITVLFDACNKHFVARDDDAEHWDVFNRTTCVASKVVGADTFYAGTQTGAGSLVNSLTAILSKNPTIDLAALEAELLNYTAEGGEEQAKVPQKPAFVAGSRFDNLAEVCLRKSLQDGKLVCNVKPVVIAVAEVKPSSEDTATTATNAEPANAVDDKKEKKDKRRLMRDDWAKAKRAGTCKPYREFVEKYPNAVFKAKAERAISNLCAEAPKKKVVKAEVVKNPSVVVAKVEDDKKQPVVEQPATKKKTPKKANAMRDDWAKAKRAGTCKPYREFVEKYPDAVFKAKAERAISNLCAERPKKNVAKVQPDPVVQEPVKVEAENTEVTSDEPEIKTDETNENGSQQTTETVVENVNQDAETTAPTVKKSSFKDWMSARKQNTCEGYRDFVENHPKTVFAMKAQKSINLLCVGNEPDKTVVAEVETKAPVQQPPVEIDIDKIPDAKITEIPNVQYIAKGSVNVRSGPGPDYPSIAMLEDNQEVIIVKSILLSNGQVWLKLKKEDRVGYSSAMNLSKVVQEPTEEPENAIEPVVENVDKQEPETAKPVIAKSASQMWRDARAADTCDAYLGFLEKHPKTLFSLKAKMARGQKCSDADRLAFSEKQKQPVPEVKVEKEPVIVAKPEPAKVPDTKVCSGVVPTSYMTKTKIPVLAAPNGSVMLSYGKNQRVQIVNEIEDYLVVRIGPVSGDYKCGYIKNEKAALQKLPETPDGTSYFTGVPEEPDKTRYALVVVNQEYTSEFEKIAGIEQDKEAVLAVISGLNYPKENVKLILNATKDDLEDAVFEFALNMKPKSDLLLYYSGYSITSLSGKTNSILPADFVVPDKKQTRYSLRRFKENSVDLETLIRDLGQGNPRQITVIYNACSGQALPEDKNAPYWLFLKPTPCSTIEIKNASIFYPVKDGQFAMTGLGENDDDKRSLFMRVFEDTVTKNPAIEIRELQKELAWSVAALAHKRQVKPRGQDPILKDGYRQDSQNPRKRCFAKTMVNGALVCTGLEGMGDDLGPELMTAQEAWQEAKRLNTCQSYRDYKKNFANTIYSIKVDQSIKENCVKPAEDVPDDIVLPATCEATGNAALPFGLTKTGYRELQGQLNRLGCNVGVADGDWGRNSQKGFDRLKKLVKLDENTAKPSCGNLDQIKAMPTKRICPLICGRGFEKVGGKCIRIQSIVKTTTTTDPAVTKNGFVPADTGTTKTDAKEKERAAAKEKERAAAKEKERAAAKTVKKEPVTPVVEKTCAKKGYVFKNGKCKPKRGFGFN